MLLISVLQIRGKMCSDNPKRAPEGRSGFPGVVTTGLDYTNVPWQHGKLAFSGVPEKPCLPHGSVYQCLIHTIGMAPDSKLVLTVRRNISCPWATVRAPAITKLFLFPSCTALSYCFFSTVPSSGWEAGLGFSLRDASLLQVPLQIFY